jgi:hypothetical protein
VSTINYVECGHDRIKQCLRCGALVGGWSFEIGYGEARHDEWHEQIDTAIAHAETAAYVDARRKAEQA